MQNPSSLNNNNSNIRSRISPSVQVRNSMLGLIVTTIWLCAFGTYISKTNNIKCQGKMWENANILFWIYVSMTIIHVIIFIMKIFHYFKQDKDIHGRRIIETHLPSKIYTIIIIFLGGSKSTLYILAFILSCIAYYYRDTCEDLQELILAFIILVSIELGLILFIPFIIFPLIALFALMAMQNNINQNPNIPNNHNNNNNNLRQVIIQGRPSNNMPSIPNENNNNNIQVGIPINPNQINQNPREQLPVYQVTIAEPIPIIDILDNQNHNDKANEDDKLKGENKENEDDKGSEDDKANENDNKNTIQSLSSGHICDVNYDPLIGMNSGNNININDLNSNSNINNDHHHHNI